MTGYQSYTEDRDRSTEGYSSKLKSPLEQQRDAVPKCNMIPAVDIVPGDVIHHLGLFAGNEWLTLVTGVAPQDDDGTFVTYETNYPLLGTGTHKRTQMADVHGHDDEALQMALRMFSGHLIEAVDEMAEAFGKNLTANDLADKLSCDEARLLANVFAAAGYGMLSEAWMEAHAWGDAEEGDCMHERWKELDRGGE